MVSPSSPASRSRYGSLMEAKLNASGARFASLFLNGLVIDRLKRQRLRRSFYLAGEAAMKACVGAGYLEGTSVWNETLAFCEDQDKALMLTLSIVNEAAVGAYVFDLHNRVSAEAQKFVIVFFYELTKRLHELRPLHIKEGSRVATLEGDDLSKAVTLLDNTLWEMGR